MPAGLQHHNALLKQSGEEEGLLRHMLKSGRMLSITEQRLRTILNGLKATVVKFAEKTITKKSLIWSLLLAVLPDVEQSEKLELFLKLSGAKHVSMVPDEITDHALKSMEPDEVRNQFEGLKQTIDRRLVDKRFRETIKRQTGEHKAKEHMTPDVIKKLRPPWNCTLVLDAGPRSSFEAYYPAGRPSKSTSMKYDSNDRSKLASLTFCVEYLWRNHLEKNRVSRL